MKCQNISIDVNIGELLEQIVITELPFYKRCDGYYSQIARNG